jgi:hypothetical protein
MVGDHALDPDAPLGTVGDGSRQEGNGARLALIRTLCS